MGRIKAGHSRLSDLLEVSLRNASEAQTNASESSTGTDRVVRNQSRARKSGSLKSSKHNPALGIIVFDSVLRCRALNGPLAGMNIIPVAEHIGKTVEEIFGGTAPELIPAFRRVLETGNNLADFSLALRLPGKAGKRRWCVNFYVLKEESGKVRLTAATFAEAAKTGNGASRLDRTAEAPCGKGGAGSSLFGVKLCELLIRSIKLAGAPVELMDETISLRFCASEAGADTASEPLHLHLSTGRNPLTIPRPVSPLTDNAGQETVSPVSRDSRSIVPSPREHQVLHLLTTGKSNKEIGSALEISTRTVETYRARLMNKLKLHSTAELVRYAIRNKIVVA